MRNLSNKHMTTNNDSSADIKTIVACVFNLLLYRARLSMSVLFFFSLSLSRTLLSILRFIILTLFHEL